MFKRFRAKVSAGTYDERSETESSDPEIRKALKSIVLTKGEKEEISGRFQDTSKMVFKELVQDVPSSFRELEKSTYTEGYLMFGTTKSMKIYSCNGNKPVLLSTENNQLSKDDVSRKKRVRNAQNLPKTQQALPPDSGDMLRLTNPNNTTTAKTETKTKLPVSHSNSMTPLSKKGQGQEKITSASTNTNNNTSTITTTGTGGSRGSNFCRIS